ncbi:MAG: flippase-like domain-containing protein [Caldilineaceae bacterium]|nr:flippase-like domain-containing protein [Caldilineaceae bacterium]
MIANLRQLSLDRLFPRRVLVRVFWTVAAFGLLWITMRSVALAEVWARLSRLQAHQLLALVIVNALVITTFSARWWLLLYAQGYRIPYAKLTGYRLVTFAVSYFTPGPHFGGEPLQVYLVTARHNVPVSAAVAAVLLDKLLEMAANFAFLAGAMLYILHRQLLPVGGQQQQLFGYAFVLLLLPGTLLAALSIGRHPLSSLVSAAGSAWRRFSGAPAQLPGQDLQARLYWTLHASEEASTALFRNHPRLVLLAAVASAASWLGIIGEFWLMTNVLGLELTLEKAILALIAARIAILLPMPAALGALEASQALAMRTMGLPPAAGVSLSLLIRARDVLVGLLGLCLGGRELWRRGRER